MRAQNIDSQAAVSTLSDAAVFTTKVNPATGELDVSGVPQEMGVYAVYDEGGVLQYIGLSKKMRMSVERHATDIGPEESSSLIASVKYIEMPGESRDGLKAAWESWIEQHADGGDGVPAGNLPDSAAGADPRWRSRAMPAKQQLSLAGPRPLEAVEAAVNEHPFVLFMKGTPAAPQCGFSAKTVGILGKLGVAYESVNVLDDQANPGVRDAVKEFSNWPTIPQLFVNGELLGGADIIGDLDERGELRARLASANRAGSVTLNHEEPHATSGDVAVPKGDVQLIDDAARPTATAISQRLNEHFDLYALHIVDESAYHEGDAGALEMGLSGESHFRISLAAPEFEGLTDVQRQQKVFAALGELMKKIHALSLVTVTPSEHAV